MRYPSPDEFLPLPYFSWDSRPETVPLDPEEAATALYLDKGGLNRAAARLKITVPRLNKVIRKSPQLQLLQAKLASASQ